MTTYYGLKIKTTKEVLTYSHSSNEGRDFCGDRTFKLGVRDYYPIWMTTEKEVAQRIVESKECPRWYNSSLDNPMNPYVGDLEIFEFSEKDLGKTVFVSNFFKAPRPMEGDQY